MLRTLGLQLVSQTAPHLSPDINDNDIIMTRLLYMIQYDMIHGISVYHAIT